uniref:Uncharacterized protein n=1 Tax=Salix viminalis TaxID=40686 RepID=A0A6N2LRX4_SALVM
MTSCKKIDKVLDNRTLHLVIIIKVAVQYLIFHSIARWNPRTHLIINDSKLQMEEGKGNRRSTGNVVKRKRKRRKAMRRS